MNSKKISQFRKEHYAAGSQPTLATLRRKIREGKLPGGYIDLNGRYWIDMEKFNLDPEFKSVVSKLKENPFVAEALKN